MEKLSSIKIFGFFANWSPFFFVALIFVSIVFFLITVKWRKDIPNSRPLTKFEGILFIFLMVLIYIVKGSPIDLLSHIMFSFHMLQMAILYLLIIPLLYFAVPNYLIDYVISLSGIKKPFEFLSKPILAIFLFNGIFSIYHLPVVLDYLKQQATLHSLFTILMSVSAFLMWYAVFNKTSLPRKQLTGLQKLFFIFMIGVLLTPSCGLIIFAQKPMYKTYTEPSAWMGAMSLCVPTDTLSDVLQNSSISGPQYFSNMTPKDDQQTGGVIMKVLQEVFFGFMLFFVFYRWYKEERIDPDVITQRDLEEHNKQKAYFKQFES
ncbi:cytochrome c oxidase assembly factor CtaG [Macrococcus sp. DPC7161]|uniref:cytochrome c oxidase assembly factor CtaG n=1 Tax=Macrococcus sp. DPC7161 TaxID=2507060 RepID=UPI00100B45E1|nr:cytochrome c oxidase assembly factor CtaG [Macrococcus sp. DPC7161]RXK18870.1 cytochrome c oxidase assembly factor CtaG [Macrococcus sp. DPC7161]